jgi:hypothetical protein
MYFLYLDDSGSPGNTTEEYFVLAGLCIHVDSIWWLNNKLNSIASELDKTNPNSIEFHAAECWRGHIEPWKSMKQNERKELLKRVLNTMEQAHPGTLFIFGCAIHKKSFRREEYISMAFEDISSKFNLFVEHHPIKDQDQKGVIIIDKSGYELGLQSLARDINQTGNRWGKKLFGICEVPLFVDSRASRLIQLADHIAYSIFRRYESGDLNYFNCIESKFENYEGKIQGLSHYHHLKKACTCPSCLSRDKNPAS